MELENKWFGKVKQKSWHPLCQIVVHSNRQSYIRAVGRGGERTLGSSAVSFSKDQITSRRIDLLLQNTKGVTEALPHELLHVVLRDRFASSTVPHWADEGMATLSDDQEKQGRHFRDLQQAIANGTDFYTADLMGMKGYPPSNRRATFYGQSTELTRFLVARKNAEHFIQFLERASAVGYDSALRECYGFASTADLDRHWRRNLYMVRLTSYSGDGS